MQEVRSFDHIFGLIEPRIAARIHRDLERITSDTNYYRDVLPYILFTGTGLVSYFEARRHLDFLETVTDDRSQR